jgi:ferric enterobactin receptor
LNGQSKRLQYGAGLRYEYSQRQLSFSNNSAEGNTLTLNNLFPSASLLYTLKDKWRIKSAYSRRIQRTNNFELNPFPEREHSETLEQGDANLLPEFTSSIELGTIKDYKGGSFFATLYYQQTKNKIQRVNSVYNDTILNRIYTNAGTAKQWGLEVGSTSTPVKWLKIYLGANVYDYRIRGSLFEGEVPVDNKSWIYSLKTNLDFLITSTFSAQLNVNYLSKRATAQGEDSYFFSPNTSIKKTFLKGRMAAVLQWQNMDMGLHISNRQRITTWGENFYTSTNYIVEPDVLLLNLSFNLKQNNKKIKLPTSEWGEQEF